MAKRETRNRPLARPKREPKPKVVEQPGVEFPLPLIQSIINYLEKQPFGEVAQLHGTITYLVGKAGYGPGQQQAAAEDTKK